MRTIGDREAYQSGVAVHGDGEYNRGNGEAWSKQTGDCGI